jgi:hypothetical protein
VPLTVTARFTLKQAITLCLFGKNILTRDTIDVGTAFAKVCCIEHTDLAGFTPEED